ncbi:putative disease resistance protein [Acorus calamus]|uniref:Disease resistance protein n=1 Tax=Acorus calamus TaxID=4465 RepID=A0AAV9C0V2_ACOCL|nr:putative disease resistance protein [Acorus calamus]
MSSSSTKRSPSLPKSRSSIIRTAENQLLETGLKECVMPLAKYLFINTKDYLVTEFNHFFRYETNIASLKTSLREFKQTSHKLHTRVQVEEKRGLTRTNTVKGWLESAESIERDAAAIVDGNYNSSSESPLTSLLERKESGPKDCFVFLFSNYHDSKKSVLLLDEIKRLSADSDFDRVAEESLPDTAVDMPQPRMRGIGTDRALARLRGCVAEDDVTIIGLFGPDGVGKTMRLIKLNSDFVGSGGEDFISVIYVDVVACSNDARRIREVIGGRLGMTPKECESRELIKRTLSHTSFLLMLDGVREFIDYEELGVPCDGGRCARHRSRPHRRKIVVATPFDYVCAHMCAEETIEVEGLGPEEAWKLFTENVGRDAMRGDAEVHALAKAVVRNCDGIPGKLIECARALAGKTTVAEWKRVMSEKGMSSSGDSVDVIDVISNI